MNENIKLGYEIGTGKEVYIKMAHLIVTGVTQKSGKTTTLESLINRSGMKSIVFRTKIGEKSFLNGTIIPPFFRDRSDWQFIEGLMEATINEKLRSFDRAKIIQIVKQTGGNSLIDFKKKIDNRLNEKINAFEKDILTNLQAYLELVLPKLQTITFSNSLELADGVNIIDLERFSRDSEVQSLIIRSVADEVLNKFKGVILVIPEAWKFMPQSRGNPCKKIIDEYIRQGATNNNFVWIDSQDMANVDKNPLKQISTWILGYQAEINEVKHTLDQMPLSADQKPKSDQIMSLGTGEFYLATREETKKTYVQPFWLDDERARKISLGELKVSELDIPEKLRSLSLLIKKEESPDAISAINLKDVERKFNKDMNELRTDFFDKIQSIQEQFNKIYAELSNLKNQPRQEIDENLIIGKILQKLPINTNNSQPSFEKEAIIKEVISRIPKGNVQIYEVAPLDKIKKDYLLKTKDKIINEVTQLSNDAKEMLKYLEAKGVGVSTNELVFYCFGYNSDGGSQRKRVLEAGKELISLSLIRKDTSGKYYSELKNKIKLYIGNMEENNEDIEQVYNHVLSEISSGKEKGIS